MPSPSIHVTVGGDPWTVIAPPAAFGAREWMLGVVAIQVFWSPGEGLSARVRAHRTGDAQALERPLGPGEAVVVRIAAAGAPSPGATEVTAALGPPSVSAFQGGQLRARADLPDAAGTPLRAFGHVFVRWRRDDPPEMGFDLTGFSPPGSAEMYGRLRSEPVTAGVTITYVVDWGRAPA